MTTIPSVEEVEERLRALNRTAALSAEDVRAIARLQVLRFPVVSPAVTRRAPARFSSGRRVAAIAAMLALVVLANLGAAYYAPRYGRALADAPAVGPVSGRILQFVGLNDRDVTVFNATATSAGHTVRLVAAYADGLRTVLFVDVNGRGLAGNPKSLGMSPGDYAIGFEGLTRPDQFGHGYALARGVQTAVALTFEPLAWPASQVGARLTLHVSAIQAEWLLGPGSDADMKGDWTLHATLISAPVHRLTLPAPVRTPEGHYTFTSLQASGTTLIVQWSVNGAALDEVNSLWMQRRSSLTSPDPEFDKLMGGYFSTKLFDAAGKEMTMWEWGYEFPTHEPAAGDMTAFVPGPARD